MGLNGRFIRIQTFCISQYIDMTVESSTPRVTMERLIWLAREKERGGE
jgi:hypothetical protein